MNDMAKNYTKNIGKCVLRKHKCFGQNERTFFLCLSLFPIVCDDRTQKNVTLCLIRQT